MDWSLGEGRAVATKAAKGAGLSWGQAEEAGFAVYWLQARSLPGAAALARYLSWRTKSSIAPAQPSQNLQHSDRATCYCPISLGTWIADSAGDFTLPAGQSLSVQQPLLVVPFVAITGTQARANSLHWHNVRFIFYDEQVVCAQSGEQLLIDRATLSVETATRSQPTQCRPPQTRIPASAECAMYVLDSFAAKTYAPATANSRNSGAGGS